MAMSAGFGRISESVQRCNSSDLCIGISHIGDGNTRVSHGTHHAKTAVAANALFRSSHSIHFALLVEMKLSEYYVKVQNNISRTATALDPRKNQSSQA